MDDGCWLEPSNIVPMWEFFVLSESSIGLVRSMSLFGARVGAGWPWGRGSPGNDRVGAVAFSIWKCVFSCREY